MTYSAGSPSYHRAVEFDEATMFHVV